MEHAVYWSHAKDGRISPAQTTTKVKYKHHSHYLWIVVVRSASSSTLIYNASEQVLGAFSLIYNKF